MGLYGGNRFKAATQGKTPDFSLAMARQGQADQEEKARVNSLRSQNRKGIMDTYNDMMGKDTPIGDQVKSWMGIGEQAPVAD